MKLNERIIDHLVFGTSKKRRLETFATALLLIILIAFFDHITGYKISFFTLYLIPILYVVARNETNFGYTLTFSCSVVSEFVNYIPAYEHNDILMFWNILRRTVMLMIIVFFVDLTIKLVRRYHNIVEDQDQLVCRYRPGGQLTFANSTYAKHFNIDRRKISTYNIFDHISNGCAENVKNLTLKFSRNNPSVNIEYESVLQDKQFQWQRWTHRAIFNTNNSILEVQAVGRDITERKKYLELKEEVDKIMLHDIKGPLSGIIGLSEALLKNKDLSDKQEEYLYSIKDAGHRILHMVGTSLDLYKMEHGLYTLNKEEIELLQVLNNMILNFHKSINYKNMAVELYLDDKEISSDLSYTIIGDKIITISMIENLLKNAIEASPVNQNVIVRLSSSKRTLSILNSGEVPIEIRKKFFDKFITSKKLGGTGLGTYSAALIAKVHGWKIDLDTTVPGQTMITIQLESEA